MSKLQPRRRSGLESLEPRTLPSGVVSALASGPAPTHGIFAAIYPASSATGGSTTGPVTSTPVTTTPVTSTLPTTVQSGIVLNETAGVGFTDTVAFYPSPVIDPPMHVVASIDWGDGTSSNATVTYSTQNGTAGYQITGTHTYTTQGNFAIATTIVLAPIPIPGRPIPQFLQLLEVVDASAVVAPGNGDTTGGVTLNETAKQSFTANVGSFDFIAPGTNLHAVINWGDGKTSVAQITPSGVVGLDEVHFDVNGSHTYAKAGTYAIQVSVFQGSPSATAAGAVSSSPVQIITTIDSTAIVAAPPPPPVLNVSLAGGTITGLYHTPKATSDTGSTYKFAGVGSAGDLGTVALTGKVQLPGLIASGSPSGTITLRNRHGSVTLSITGPSETGFSTFPDMLTYQIISGTGAYLGAAGSGSIAVTLGSGSNSTAAAGHGFTFLFS